LFFEKPMASNQVIHIDSALPENSKMSSLNNEVGRRMTNTSELLQMEDRVEMLNRYAQKLTNSGYGLDQTRKILVGGLKGYEKRLEQSKGGRPLHQSAASSRGQRYTKKLTAKTSWFKDKPRGEDTTQRSDGECPDAKMGSSGGRTGENSHGVEKTRKRKWEEDKTAKRKGKEWEKSGRLETNKKKRTEIAT
jgi:hypothetical protein